MIQPYEFNVSKTRVSKKSVFDDSKAIAKLDELQKRNQNNCRKGHRSKFAEQDSFNYERTKNTMLT